MFSESLSNHSSKLECHDDGPSRMSDESKTDHTAHARVCSRTCVILAPLPTLCYSVFCHPGKRPGVMHSKPTVQTLRSYLHSTLRESVLSAASTRHLFVPRVHTHPLKSGSARTASATAS